MKPVTSTKDKTPARQVVSKFRMQLAYAWVFFAALMVPEIAAADIAGTVDWVVTLLTTGIARGIAVIGVVACGFMAMAGRLPMAFAVSVIFGIMLIFGAGTVVDAISGAAA